MTLPNEAKDLTLRGLYPDLSDDERAAADESLDRYVALILRIYERIREDPDAYARFKALTGPKPTTYDGSIGSDD